jgi:bacterioferritin-associated ferredoxin
MIVCLCKGVSSRTILDEVRRGCRSVSDVARACQAGTGCGACVRQIKDLIDAASLHREHATSLPPR